MSKTLTIRSVKCIRPASGVDGVARGIFGSIGAAIAGAATVAGATITGGLLVGATGVAAAGGAATGVATVDGVDGVFSGEDDLYIKVNNRKVWPRGDEDAVEIKSQQTKDVNHRVALDRPVTIQLMEYDWGSADDKLGYLTVQPDHQEGNFTYLVQNKDEGSICNINIRIAS